jgi:hypothetical protein
MSPGRLQFDLRGLLCGMIVISLGLAFLRVVNEAFLMPGLIAAAGALVLGTVIGIALGRVADTQFWAVLGASFAFLSAVEVVQFHWAWAGAGAAGGAAIGGTAGGPWWRTLLAGSLATTAALAVYWAFNHAHLSREFYFDLAAAPVIGAAFGLLVDIFFRLERRTALPRYVTATVLMAAICVGNFLAR